MSSPSISHVTKGAPVADDPTAEVTIKYPPTEETRTVMAGAVSGFTNHGWVVLDSTGRVNTRATSAANTSKES